VRHLKKEIWPYQITVNHKQLNVIDRWCENMVGDMYHEWYAHDNIYAFKDEGDFIIFKLTWDYDEKTI
jgi:hypothetical protein